MPQAVFAGQASGQFSVGMTITNNSGPTMTSLRTAGTKTAIGPTVKTAVGPTVVCISASGSFRCSNGIVQATALPPKRGP